ncbi:MAG: NTP transferase domain-containing protein [Bryobacteraceae bacterium]
MSVAGIILAAGASRRMGTHKALLDYRGETFLDRLIGCLVPYCSPVVVVLGAGAVEIQPRLIRGAQARIVVNPDWEAGQLTSLQCGLRALEAPCGVLFTLVDHPAVRPETVARLAAGPGLLRIPRFAGRRGHPVYFASQLIPEFLALGPAASARDVVDRHADRTVYVDVDDPGIACDIDDPAAYRQLLEGRL